MLPSPPCIAAKKRTYSYGYSRSLALRSLLAPRSRPEKGLWRRTVVARAKLRKKSHTSKFCTCFFQKKLMPMIKYLSEKMGFNDNLVKSLCTFKEIPVKGKLYSTMFNQSFSADGTVCSLKEDKEGRFDLRIDGISHHSCFRRKKDEFMEALGLPTSRRQNRGLKL